MKIQKTFSQKPAEVTRNWYIVDANGMTLGRLAVAIAKKLSGKQKTTYTPHVDAGDYVIVINARSVKVSGRKEEQKIYWRHSGYPGGIKGRTLAEQRAKNPRAIIESAVKGMLPRNKLAKGMLKRLKVYADDQHEHTAQKPKELKI